MLVTTTPGIEGRPVTGYLGIVTAQGVLGVNAFKDVSAGTRNIFGQHLPGRVMGPMRPRIVVTDKKPVPRAAGAHQRAGRDRQLVRRALAPPEAGGRIGRVVGDEQPHPAAMQAAVGVELVHGHDGEVLAGHREHCTRAGLAGQQADPIVAVICGLAGGPAAPPQQPFHAALVDLGADADPCRGGPFPFQANPELAAPRLVERDHDLPRRGE